MAAAAVVADLQSAVARLLQASGREAATQALRDELARLGSVDGADGDVVAIGATTACSTDEAVPTIPVALRQNQNLLLIRNHREFRYCTVLETCCSSRFDF